MLSRTATICETTDAICPTTIQEAGAYSPLTNLMYMPLRHTCGRMLATAGVGWYALTVRTEVTPGEQHLGTIEAISAETGETVWTHDQPAFTMSLVATGGGLVFGGDANGRFKALDHETGDVLWEINLGSPVTGFPVTYAAGGRQYVAVSTGRSLNTSGLRRLTPDLRPSDGNTLFVFALP